MTEDELNKRLEMQVDSIRQDGKESLANALELFVRLSLLIRSVDDCDKMYGPPSNFREKLWDNIAMVSRQAEQTLANSFEC